MKAKDKTTGTFKEVYVKALDSLPVGSEIDFDGTSANIPVGWEEITDPNSYSTTEDIVIGTWYDGKPIYRRVLVAYVGNNTIDFAHNIPNINQIIKLSGVLEQDSGYAYPMPYLSETAGYTVEYGLNRTNCYIKVGSSIVLNHYAIIIVEFTKTTD